MNSLIAQFGPIGWPQLLIVLLIVLLLFGNRLPSVLRSLGRGLIEFKRGFQGEADEIADDPAKKTDPPARS